MMLAQINDNSTIRLAQINENLIITITDYNLYKTHNTKISVDLTNSHYTAPPSKKIRPGFWVQWDTTGVSLIRGTSRSLWVTWWIRWRDYGR